MRHLCHMPGCEKEGPFHLKMRLMRPDTTAVWAPGTDFWLCADHATGGIFLDVVAQPTADGKVVVHTAGVDGEEIGLEANTTTEITQGAHRKQSW